LHRREVVERVFDRLLVATIHREKHSDGRLEVDLVGGQLVDLDGLLGVAHFEQVHPVFAVAGVIAGSKDVPVKPARGHDHADVAARNPSGTALTAGEGGESDCRHQCDCGANRKALHLNSPLVLKNGNPNRSSVLRCGDVRWIDATLHDSLAEVLERLAGLFLATSRIFLRLFALCLLHLFPFGFHRWHSLGGHRLGFLLLCLDEVVADLHLGIERGVLRARLRALADGDANERSDS